MKGKQQLDTVFIGVIPGAKNLAGVPFRTDLAGMYHRDIDGCKYMCRINGGKHKYFFIEERYFFSDKPAGEKLGNIRKIHHFNQGLQEDLPEPQRPTRMLLPIRKRKIR